MSSSEHRSLPDRDESRAPGVTSRRLGPRQCHIASASPVLAHDRRGGRDMDERAGHWDGPAVEVGGLTKTYPGGVEAVRGIDFEVAPGEVFGLLGPNGAGKSTTIGMLTTTIRPSGGTARLGGFDVVEQPLAARRVSSVVFQEPVVDRALTGRANLELHARLWGSGSATRMRELTAALGL